MVEWVGVFVSAVGILLQRISDKEKKLEQRIDVKDALMDLLHLVREWERLAERTNQSLLEWISKEKTEDELLYRQELRETAQMQIGSAAGIASFMGLSEDYFAYQKQTSTHPERSTLADLFHVYAPDLESDVRKVLDIRLTQLQILIEGLDQGEISDIQQAVNALTPEVDRVLGWDICEIQVGVNALTPEGESPLYLDSSHVQQALNRLPEVESPLDWDNRSAVEAFVMHQHGVRWAAEDRSAQEIARAYEHSARLLKELSKTLASYIRQNWNVKEQTLGK